MIPGNSFELQGDRRKAGAVRKGIALFYRPWGLFESVEGAVYFPSPLASHAVSLTGCPLGGTPGEGIVPGLQDSL